MAVEVLATRRRIIRRPRLTKLLDEDPARIKLLVAPAGYGKTTLAKEWLTDDRRRAGWYRGTSASADVAALAAGLAEAASEIVPDAGKRMRERLRATGHPEEDVEILAELFAEDVQTWPTDAWVCIDDYHFAMDRAASERFVELVVENTPLQMVITSRRRPTWATARRILYGEIQEVDRHELAMDASEAHSVLGGNRSETAGLLEQAAGWPAIIGLAALTKRSVTWHRFESSTLSEYVAQELYASADVSLRTTLSELALAPGPLVDVAIDVFGPREGRHVIDEGLRQGVLLVDAGGDVVFHPLMRSFFAGSLDDRSKTSAAERIIPALMKRGAWDEALDLAIEAGGHGQVIGVVEEGLRPLVSVGRVATLARWSEVAAHQQLTSPTIDLLEAEVAFRAGDHLRAYLLADEAGKQMKNDHPLYCQARIRAGWSALLGGRENEALASFEAACNTARDDDERREALIGFFSATSELELPEGDEAYRRLVGETFQGPDAKLRRATFVAVHATRRGSVDLALEELWSCFPLLDRAEDPVVITGFTHVLSHALSLSAKYAEGHAMSARTYETAQSYRLRFVTPFALLDRAIAEIGLRRFGDARGSIRAARRLLPPEGNPFVQATAAILRARIALSEHRFSAALEELRRAPERAVTPPIRAEISISRALATACSGRHSDGLRLVREAEVASRAGVEARVAAAAVRAICAGERDAVASAHHAWREAIVTGAVDPLVAAYRGFPRLLARIYEATDADPTLIALIERAGDHALAQDLGVRVGGNSTDPLTRRERQILDLVAKGLSNREVAEELVIAESTVKAHLRHVNEKLSARNRTEALAKWATLR